MWLSVLLACACASPVMVQGDTQAKREVIVFIDRLLSREQGEGWERTGQYFAWSFNFSGDGCTLHATRRELTGSRVLRQAIPLDRTRPGWDGSTSLIFACDQGPACIDTLHQGVGLRDEFGADDTQLFAPDPHDLPKLADAFTELKRLCDDPYRLPPEGPAFPRGQDYPGAGL
ncbi:hypothetical protein [Polycyclovorans algicola]|uniref:hypothetical protein n=1 Tax=Polycyclovorans algicola TaxID=616992 RepID=UPI0004A74B4F|nr:hypothetical protein [Polycyclovorans algicola]